MKKLSLIILILVFISITLIKANDVMFYRKMYYKSAISKKEAELFLEEMKKSTNNDSYSIAYKGMAYMLMANHAFNPYNKINYFSKGKSFLEDAIKIDSENIELRFLRFCIQTNAPSFLFYNSNIVDDKIIIMKNWSTLNDADLKFKIKEYMTISKYISQQEKINFQ